MKASNGLIQNNRKVFNISLLSSCGLAAIAGMADFEGLHEFAGYVFLALTAIHVRIYWKIIKDML